jgi:hypothetical protein
LYVLASVIVNFIVSLYKYNAVVVVVVANSCWCCGSGSGSIDKRCISGGSAEGVFSNCIYSSVVVVVVVVTRVEVVVAVVCLSYPSM